MGNSGDERFEPLLERLKSDEDPVVAESAEWAAKRLSENATVERTLLSAAFDLL